MVSTWFPYNNNNFKFRDLKVNLIQFQLIGVLEPFASHLYTTFTSLMKDEDPEVRNNATFGLGELVLHGRELLYP